MEKLSPSLLRQHNGVLKLPPGFRFHPTDEELVVQYLRRKVFSCPLPACIIPEIDLGKYNPWDLPAGGCEQEQERYFFALRGAKYPTGNRSNRATGCGYWKATGKDRAIVAASQLQVVGMKKSLVFHRRNGERTDWIMHEYRLATRSASVFPQRKNSSTHSAAIVVAPRDWVLCRIFMKKKRATKMDVDNEEHHEERLATGFIDFTGQRNDNNRRPSSPSASDSSCVTDESSNGEDTTSTT